MSAGRSKTIATAGARCLVASERQVPGDLFVFPVSLGGELDRSLDSRDVDRNPPEVQSDRHVLAAPPRPRSGRGGQLLVVARLQLGAPAAERDQIAGEVER